MFPPNPMGDYGNVLPGVQEKFLAKSSDEEYDLSGGPYERWPREAGAGHLSDPATSFGRAEGMYVMGPSMTMREYTRIITAMDHMYQTGARDTGHYIEDMYMTDHVMWKGVIFRRYLDRNGWVQLSIPFPENYDPRELKELKRELREITGYRVR